MSGVQGLLGEAADWLKEWQFLVGTIAFLIGVALIVHAINRQMHRQHLEAKEARRRLVNILRATLPEDLDLICFYARRSAEVARQVALLIDEEERSQTASLKRRKRRLRFPSLPGHIIAHMKELISNSDDVSAEKLAELLGCYYVQHHRLSDALQGFEFGTSKSTNLNPVFKSTLELYLRATHMLPFALGEAESIPEGFEGREILSSLKELNIDDVVAPEVREHCVSFLATHHRL